VTVNTYKIERSSIRAIQVNTQISVSYAGSSSAIGFTTNNGERWHTLHVSYQDTITPDFRSFDLNGTDYFALSIGNPALLYKISNEEATLKYVEKDPKVFYNTLTFFEDNLHRIAVGDPIENFAAILVSTDGSETWKKVSCENLPKMIADETFFAASNTSIKTIGNTVWIGSGVNKTKMLKSRNFGKTWQVFETPIIQENGPQESYSIDFYAKNNGIIIGGDYAELQENTTNKAITSDGGKTWTLIANKQNQNNKSCVQYVPNTNGKEIFTIGKTGVSFSIMAEQLEKKCLNMPIIKLSL
jgi:photosystem II stability/assembly factor-like uncharacterized protein